MKTPCLTDVPFHDPRRSLQLFECQEEDHLAVQEWLDRHLRGDYLFKKQHLKSIITRPTSCLFAILFDGLYVGTAVVYNGSVLHNIMIAEEWRGLGIGEAVIRFLAPSVIRAKTNMKDGDPVPFYQALGYKPKALDPDRPHIVVMEPAPGEAPAEVGLHVSVPQAEALPGAVSEPAPVSPVVVVPPELDHLRVAAEKWLALKRRQRERQARRKAAKTAVDTEYATRYVPHQVSLNGHADTGEQFNTCRD